MGAAGLSLILAGAVGNLVDRVLHGRVTDFLLFHWHGWYFPAFNLADACVTVGTFCVIFEEFFFESELIDNCIPTSASGYVLHAQADDGSVPSKAETVDYGRAAPASTP